MMSDTPKGAPRRRIDVWEQTAIATLLGLMTLITFINVVLRYGFNSGFIWGLEATLILFAWLVIFGVSHAFRVTAHLGVDAATSFLPAGPKRAVALLSAAVCIFYALLMLKGAWDYWAPFAGFQVTTGRWFPTGFDASTRDRAFYITEQIPMPWFLEFLAGWINQGEEWEKLPRFIPYFILPLGISLLLLRLLQATREIYAGSRESLIVSHEAEDAVESVAALNRES
jgi:C4-dicarboxylate transporter, DctQ subunit